MPLLLGILPRSVHTHQNSVTWPHQDAARKSGKSCFCCCVPASKWETCRRKKWILEGKW